MFIAIALVYLMLGFVKTSIHYFYIKYPKFYYKSLAENKLGVPVIMYHTITTDELGQDLIYLQKNNYYTLTTNEFYQYIKTGSKPAEKCILLTTDDGRKSLYKVIYPLLEKYQMKATAFILPYHHEHPNAMSDFIPDRLKTKKEVFECSFDGQMFCNWKEIQKMHESGLVDFQSHTLNQYRIPVSNEIVDFYHPKYRTGFALDRLPIFLTNEFEYEHALDYGRPIYKNASRLAGFKGYKEDIKLYTYCTQYVQKNGGIHFFNKSKWRDELFDMVKKYKMNYEIDAHYESEENKKETMLKTLYQSKIEIESKLSNHEVQFIAAPWGESAHLTTELSKSIGYQALFITDKNGLRCCFHGASLFFLPRIDHKNHVIQSLPGKGRITFARRFLNKWMYYLIHPYKS